MYIKSKKFKSIWDRGGYATVVNQISKNDLLFFLPVVYTRHSEKYSVCHGFGFLLSQIIILGHFWRLLWRDLFFRATRQCFLFITKLTIKTRHNRFLQLLTIFGLLLALNKSNNKKFKYNCYFREFFNKKSGVTRE